MADEQYQYPFDPTATVNWVPNERHTISPPDYMDHYFVVPLVAPFYEKDLKIIHYPSGKELINGTDYVLSYKFRDASKALGKDVFGAISIYGRTLSGVLDISYRPLGGDWSINAAKAAELLANAISNPRITTWEQVVELPYKFPVIDHEWDLNDLVGASELVAAIEAIRTTLSESSGAEMSRHIANVNNPHGTTKAHVGLGLVQNYPMATAEETLVGDRADRYVSPRACFTAIQTLAVVPLADHIANKSNPHQVTKAQVGLSNLDNYGTADDAIAMTGQSKTHFITPYGVRLLIGQLVSPELGEHVNTMGNPHGTTKTDIGLGNVPNYGMATELQAADGNVSNAFMAPHTTKVLIEAMVMSTLRGHINTTGNPHGLTTADLNLDRVANYAPATEVDAAEATSDTLYMTPYMTRVAIMELVGDHFESHLADRNNPHRVNKAQVGLSEVLNFGLASEPDAVLGEALEGYMTPYLTAAAIRALAVVPLTAHLEDLENPHQVTKQQVGLGNVQDFGVAGLPEAQLGESESLYMTPATTKAAVQAFAGNALTNHTSATNNPHQVTKQQVGLDLVDNFATASPEETALGQATNLFVTPAGLAAYIETNGLGGGGASDEAVADLTARIQALTSSIEGHLTDQDNPHNLTLDSLGGVSLLQVQQLLSEKLDATATAVDSALLEGRSLADITAEIEAIAVQESDNNYAMLQRNFKHRMYSTTKDGWWVVGELTMPLIEGEPVPAWETFFNNSLDPITLLLSDGNPVDTTGAGGLDQYTLDMGLGTVSRVSLNGADSMVELMLVPVPAQGMMQIVAFVPATVRMFSMTVLSGHGDLNMVDSNITGGLSGYIGLPNNAIRAAHYGNPAGDLLADVLAEYVDELVMEIQS